MKRRDFVLVAVGIGAVSTAAYYFFGDVKYNPGLAEPPTVSLIWDDETINTIGNRYRKDFPSEDGARTLVKLLGDSPDAMDQKIADDFKKGNIVVVEGWILSVTEARQCALASISKDLPQGRNDAKTQ
jgi:hypothetical protein